MGAEGQVLIRILGDSKGLGKSLGDADGKLGKFAGGALKAGAAIGAAFAAVGGAVFAVGSEFDKAYDTIRVGTGATGDALTGLKDDFKAVFADVPATAADVGTAIADLNTRTGQTGEGLQELSKQILELSRITGTDVATNVAATTRMFGDWSIATEDQAGALDKLFLASQATGAGVDTLAQQVVNFGSPLRQMGFSFEESLAIFGKFEKEGVNVESVMSGLRMGLKNFAKAGEEPAKALQRVIEEIQGAETAAEGTSLAFEVFGARAGPDMAAAIMEGRFNLEELLGVIEGGGDTILGAADDTRDFGESWQQLKNNVLLILEPIANRVFGTLSDWMQRLLDFVQSGGIQEGFNQLKTVFEAVGDAWTLLTGIFQGDPMAEEVASQMGGAGEAVSGFGNVLRTLAEIVGEVFATVQEWIALAQEWWTNHRDEVMAVVDEVAAYLDTVFKTIAEIFRAAFDVIQTIVSTAISIIQGFWDRFGTHILSYIRVTWENIKRVIDGALKIIKGVFDVFAGLFTGDWSRMWDGVKSIFSGAWDIIKSVFSQAWNALKTILGAGVAIVSQLWSELWERVSAVFKSAWERLTTGIRDGVANVVKFFRDLPGNIIRALGNVGSLLHNAGREILQGLWNGLKEKWESVKDWVGGLGDQIKNLKGPIEADRVLLVDEGRAIMAGLGAGLADGWEDIEDQLGGMTAQIGGLDLGAGSGTLSAPAVGPASSGTGRVVALLDEFFSSLGEDWERNFDMLATREQEGWDRLIDTHDSGWATLETRAESGMQGVATAVRTGLESTSKAADAFAGSVMDAADKITQAAKATSDAAKTAANAARTAAAAAKAAQASARAAAAAAADASAAATAQRTRLAEQLRREIGRR